MKDWGKDHWSLLAYVETCCVDNEGRLGHERMRCNEKRHPLLKTVNIPWESGHGTVMKNGMLEDHDDWDCLEDLETEGLIEIISSISGVVVLTEKGKELANKLRNHKADGGRFGNFDPKIKELELKVKLVTPRDLEPEIREYCYDTWNESLEARLAKVCEGWIQTAKNFLKAKKEAQREIKDE